MATAEHFLRPPEDPFDWQRKCNPDFLSVFADKGQSAVSYSFRYGRQEKAVFLGTLGGFDIIHIANPFDT